MLARANLRVRDIDRGFDRLVRNAIDAQSVRLRAGVLPADAGRRYPGQRSTVGEVAAFNELGTDRMRARPFLGSWFARRSGATVAQVVEILRRNLRDGAARRSLHRVATRARDEIRASLRAYDVRDTGLLERSISAVVDVLKGRP